MKNLSGTLAFVRQRNNAVAWGLVDYLNENARFITARLVSQVDPDGLLPLETVYTALISGACGLEGYEQDYLYKGIKKLDVTSYNSNAYYKNIHIPSASFGNWKLTSEHYEPYEAFVYRDLLFQPDFREIPQIGFFTEPFSYPCVMENNHEWMAIKPNEIETMSAAVQSVSGNVLTFGLGLGYFAYMASRKEQVRHVTVVERDNQVIALFNRFILPQFENPDKITVICADAFDFADNELPKATFDWVFTDLWHDASDGLDLYLQMKGKESLCPSSRYLYWIETSLLSALRWQVFDAVMEGAANETQAVMLLRHPLEAWKAGFLRNQ